MTVERAEVGPGETRRRLRGLVASAAGALCALALAAPASGATTVAVRAQDSRYAATVDPRFLSVAVDLDQVVGGKFWSQRPGEEAEVPVRPYDFSRPALLRLARQLAPAYLRISGTAANNTYYDLSARPSATPPPGYNRVLTRRQWDAANRFAARAGMRVFFGVHSGSGPRTADGAWSPDNARALLLYTAKKRYPLGALELGNEPNLWWVRAGLSSSYTAASYARDVRAFEQLRRKVAPRAVDVGPGTVLGLRKRIDERPVGAPGRAALALGPEARDVLPLLPKNFYGAVNYHWYNAFSTRCAIEPHLPSDPLAPAWLGLPVRGFDYVDALRDRYEPRRPIWLGETGSAACGGQPGYSDRFIETFFFLNQLGALSQRGVQVLVRQTLSGSDYGLIDDRTLEPNPDYWGSVLWRRLMGTRHLDLRARGGSPSVRIYGACTPGTRGGVSMLALNSDRRASARLRLGGRGTSASLYQVTSTNLRGRTVRLNGRVLKATRGGRLPRLSPRRVRSGTIVLPPVSYAYVVQPHAHARACGRR